MKGEPGRTWNEGTQPELEPAAPASIPTPSGQTHGQFVTLDGQEAYRISAFDQVPPFFMSIASDTDVWMFVTSTGGLTAGRVDPSGNLFPYETVDRLYQAHHYAGPITLIRVRADNDETVLWEPFRTAPGDPNVERNLYKNTIGDRLVFEEIRHDLGLVFRYRWASANQFGVVRTATLKNRGTRQLSVEVLDGLRNVQPFGVPLTLEQTASNLTDAYKQSELIANRRLGIFALTSEIVDRAEAAESLRANTVWCHGLDAPTISLGADAIDAFRRKEAIVTDSVRRGQRGNFIVTSSLELEPSESRKWHLVADVGLNHVQIVELRQRILQNVNLDQQVERGIQATSDTLSRNVASADGLQLTAQSATTAHHFANVLFNNMRGGVPAKNHEVSVPDFIRFVGERNHEVARQHQEWTQTMPEELSATKLRIAATVTGDADFQRLSYEYLPIFFSRRHGDPSRPWNLFAIRVRNDDGSQSLRYQGNWRDIFQNWEALSLSFPRFLPNFIARFVNASTVDGFNPYRLTDGGFDWEVEDPEDPWSYIGYWGDHQIIYLLKFLEHLTCIAPGELESMMNRDIFSYANVPYRLKSYDQIVQDPHNTIEYDKDLAKQINQAVSEVGTDAKLVRDSGGDVLHVNLIEKLLVPALSKLSNLVAGGGIWMNTQRPEWNDANNALVGDGVSMVTLYYLRRYLRFLAAILEGSEMQSTQISTEVVDWLHQVDDILLRHQEVLQAPVAPSTRRSVLDELGRAFSTYRERVYAQGFSGRQSVPMSELVELTQRAQAVLDTTIAANRRDDGLYHAYNLVALNGDTAEVTHLSEMLEGQVAALSSGAIDASEAADILDQLFASDLYREAERSFMLYPESIRGGFMDRNVLPTDRVEAIPLLVELMKAQDHSLVDRDLEGTYRFHGTFRNADDVNQALDQLATETSWDDRVAQDRTEILALFEDVFQHQRFTGRSGTMYGYEGIGCIYWHMVTKLLVVVQEITLRALAVGEPKDLTDRLLHHYYRVRAGLGFEKTVSEFGAFPADPYSHTPGRGGAQQPGMTGQVKEEILTRFGELGVRVEAGSLRFDACMLKSDEFRTEPGSFSYYDVFGATHRVDVPLGSLAFTYCQVPVLYHLVDEAPWIRVTKSDGANLTHEGTGLDASDSRAIFDRRGGITRIDVGVPRAHVWHG